MRGMRGVVALAAAALIAAVAAPAGATPSGGVMNGSYRFTGQMAEASWASESEDPGIGMPRNLALVGFHAVATSREKGSRPTTETLYPMVAYSTTLIDSVTGEPYNAEVWAVGTWADFVMAADLSEATVAFHTEEAYIVGWDPVAEKEVVIGTMPLTVSVTWTGDGPLVSTKSHDKFVEDGMFRISNATTTTRHATVEFTLTWSDGSHLDGACKDGQMSDIRSGDFQHYWPQLP
ncbi:hypothetical protein [Longivirga aurantiaca]|uniref:Uncharacterized protein n=1 Tax=Longivirga aurantiaca TaxID=1837743 RepID=A0ABW1T0I2_9ACTN